MTENSGSSFCPNCGNPVQEGDRFCGVCGTSVAPVTPENPQVIPRRAAARAAPARNNRTLLVAGAVGVLLVLLVGGGAIALVGSGANLFGGSEPGSAPTPATQEPVAAPETTQELTPVPETTQSSSTEFAETAPDSSSSERDQFAKFARDYYEASRRGDWEATYSMLYATSAPEVTDSQDAFTEEEWIDIYQTLRESSGPPPALESVSVNQNEEVTDSPAEVTLYYEDGTQQTITVTIPFGVRSGDNTGPQRLLTEEEISELKSVEVADGSSEPTDSGSTVPLEDTSVVNAEIAAGDYYRAAGSQDWGFTYDDLDSETQSMFTEEEWFRKNQWFWDQGETAYDVLSVEMVSDSEEPLAEVDVRLTGEDGSSFVRTTYWVVEDGEWLHRFSQEETDLFMPELSFEEFVEAQGG